MIPYKKSLKHVARMLRSNMTDAERLLWSRLRRKQLSDHQFYRQRPIGDYIVDFSCPSRMLVVEVDGSQHYTNEGSEKNHRRDEYLQSIGFTVLRFAASDVMKNIDGVAEAILEKLQGESPHPPSQKGE